MGPVSQYYEFKNILLDTIIQRSCLCAGENEAKRKHVALSRVKDVVRAMKRKCSSRPQVYVVCPNRLNLCFCFVY